MCQNFLTRLTLKKDGKAQSPNFDEKVACSLFPFWFGLAVHAGSSCASWHSHSNQLRWRRELPIRMGPRSGRRHGANGDIMKKAKTKRSTMATNELDTMRPEYDFSGAVRGMTAARYAKGANVVVVDPELLDVSPDGVAVNEALHALAPVLRRRQTGRQRKKVA